MQKYTFLGELTSKQYTFLGELLSKYNTFLGELTSSTPIEVTTLHTCSCQKRLHIHHANIVQRVKTCYKIKIDYRVLICCFYGVLLCKQHPSLTIAPLLHYNSATIRV